VRVHTGGEKDTKSSVTNGQTWL